MRRRYTRYHYRTARRMIIASFAAWLLTLAWVLTANAADPRYTGQPPVRDADGAIHRSSAVISEFKREHPCPSTGLTKGACPGWSVDHVIPLVCGGVDSILNLQWLPLSIKSASGPWPKDRWEQRVYCRPTPPASGASQ